MAAEFDPWGFTGTLSWIVILLVWFIVLSAQKDYTLKESHGMVILALRGASLLPLFMTFIFISLWWPDAYPVMKIPGAFFEGYGVYCMWGLMVRQCGGWKGARDAFMKSNRNICWPLETPDQCETFYNNANSAIWQFGIVRPYVVTLAAICDLAGVMRVYLVFTAIAAISTLVMLPYLFLSAHVMYDYCADLNIIVKLAVVKVAVGAVLIEDVVQQIMFQTNALDIPDTPGLDGYTESSQYIRIYCTLALLEGVLLCIPLYLGFSPKMDLSTAAKAIAELEEDTSSDEGRGSGLDKVDVSWWDFMVSILFNPWQFPVDKVVNENEQEKEGLLDNKA